MMNLSLSDKFVNRHIGPASNEISEMLKVIGFNSLDELIDKTIPLSIRLKKPVVLDEPLSEFAFIKELTKLVAKNEVFKSYIGYGYYPVILPPVIQRNILENPGWYTQYTPYQAEISQGRLEALLNFQTVVCDLTGLPIANASLLDEGTSAAEAMLMFHNLSKMKKPNAKKFFVSNDCFPQTIDVLETRAVPLGIEIVIGDFKKHKLDDSYFGLLVQYPGKDGQINDFSNLFKDADEKKIFKIVAADIMSLTLLTPPAEFGADAAVGSTQRLGVPMGYGGPHAAYFATKDEFKRSIPGRIIGVSVDRNGGRAYRMALQTREQHIKREKATSNICTAQVLLAITASMYAVYHGPEGLKATAGRIHSFAKLVDNLLKEAGYNQVNNLYFDTLKIVFDKNSSKKIPGIKKKAVVKKVNFRYEADSIGISLNETCEPEDIMELLGIFGIDKPVNFVIEEAEKIFNSESFPDIFNRKSKFLTEPVFNKYRSETELLRYIKSLENKDLSLTGSMTPLGSCTMKLNATAEMVGITMPGLANIHPFAPAEQVKGYLELIKKLEYDLCSITGFAGMTLQPNSGAQGEYTGLMIIRQYHISRGDTHRDIVLIPSSAHGTNPASAVMAGMKVVVVACDNHGNIDVDDLRKKSELHKDNLAALMVTYPSTHGVFEESILEICKIVHSSGGQVYMDGANMNAQVGLTSPASIGADVCHLNLHKTFCIPHGGGGPGVGPVGVASHLVEFLPGHTLVKTGGKNAIKAVSSAPYGSPGVLVISYAYILMMGTEGLAMATKAAILNANYIKARLENDFKVVYTGINGTVAHELIFDLHEFKVNAGVEADDVAKRLMDYGFHAPTVSFPVHGTFMVEPTESESKVELDRFCDAMLSIRKEIKEIEDGVASKEDNLLKNAPFTSVEIASDKWNHPFSRERAAFPVESLKLNKYWTPVGRINNAYGDRNLVCCCGTVEDYAEVK